MQASTVCMRANIARVHGRLSMGVLVRAESCAVVRVRAFVRVRARARVRSCACVRSRACARASTQESALHAHSLVLTLRRQRGAGQIRNAG
eukprot:1827775-Pleurochrysis_carterae.AAC.1